MNRLISDHQYTAIASATGIGKTYNFAGLFLYFLNCWEDSIVLTTATTWTQVRSQLWREIRLAHAESRIPLPGSPLQTELELGAKWYGLGISTRKPESIAGFHAKAAVGAETLAAGADDFDLDPDFLAWWAKHRAGDAEAPVFVLVDEASGVPDELFFALDGLMTNPGSKMALSGNPLALSGRHYEAFHPPMGTDLDDWPWETLRISAFDAPEEIVDRKWIDHMRRTCGPSPEKNPHYMSRVLGQHPTSSDKALFPMVLLEIASEIVPKFGGRHIGVDIGRTGDKCVAVLTVDGRVASLHAWSPGMSGGDLMRSARIIRKLAKGWDVPARNVHVDVTGMGWGVYDRLWEYSFGVDAVNFGAGIEEDWRDVLGHSPPLRTRRQELHWLALRCFQEGFLSVPKDDRYAPIWSDLTAIERRFDGKDAMIVESKDAYKERVGRSPDYSDALLCSLSRTNPAKVRFRVLSEKGRAPRARRIRRS